MSDESYSAACAAVVTEFVRAYPVYLAAKLRQVAPDGDATDGVRQGREWLEGELGEWARRDASQQTRGPLQIFQTACAFPTTMLEAAGHSPVERDPGAVRAMPGDIYGLAPASSRDIGEAAWRAHVAWGVAKAKIVAAVVPSEAPALSPTVAVVTMDKADRSAVHLVAAGRGLGARHWRNPGAIEAGLAEEIPKWSIVDSTHAAADEAVRALAAAGSKVIVYAEEPDDIAMARWMALGAATVVRRRELVAVMESRLPLQA